MLLQEERQLAVVQEEMSPVVGVAGKLLLLH